MRIVNYISNKIKTLWAKIEIAGYTDETIADLFRKQGARIGKNCRLQIRRLASEPYLVTLGNHVAITGGALLHTHDGGAWILKEKWPEFDTFGTITIDDNCVIGTNAQILPNVHIGRNTIIGAGSVVISDIPPNSIAMGVPARVIGSVTKYEEKHKIMWEQQRPPDLRLEEGQDYWDIKGNQDRLRRHLMKLFRLKEENSI